MRIVGADVGQAQRVPQFVQVAFQIDLVGQASRQRRFAGELPFGRLPCEERQAVAAVVAPAIVTRVLSADDQPLVGPARDLEAMALEAPVVASDLPGVREALGDVNGRLVPVDDPEQRQPDNTKARELLGWEPKVDLREGLERTIAYFATLV